MLVLSRKPSEAIVIEFPGREPVVVRILAVEGRRVRIGLEGPAEAHFVREEIQDRKAA